LLLAGLIFIFSVSNYRIARERSGNEEKIELLKAELDLLEARKMDLEESLKMADEKEYVERILREDFLMKKPGEEKVVILLDDEEVEAEDDEEVEKSGWQRLIEALPLPE